MVPVAFFYLLIFFSLEVSKNLRFLGRYTIRKLLECLASFAELGHNIPGTICKIMIHGIAYGVV
jgi:hypothetical protein